MTRKLILPAILVSLASLALAHDTWVQPNTNLVRVGDVVHIDLMLGNHGNDHRDFKLAGKTTLDGLTIAVIDPNGASHDLKSALTDQGLGPKEGFWTASFHPSEPGLHLVVQTSDRVVDYAPTRSIKSAKTMFVASRSLDRVEMDHPGFDRVMGHPLELVPLTNPVTPMGPGTPIRVRLMYKGKPLSDARISFIPRGVKLSESFDDRYEQMTDGEGAASFEPNHGNYYLIVAHHQDANDKGEGYDSTKYSATLAVFVPAVCPCCGG